MEIKYNTFLSFVSVAEDGQQMFLHPVNVRCLLREYGSLENSPQSITATVVEIDGQTVTEVHTSLNSHTFMSQNSRSYCQDSGWNTS